MGSVPDLRWEDVEEDFDLDTCGHLPDVCVSGTSAADWQALFDLVRSKGWWWRYVEGRVTGRLPRAVDVLGRPPGAECVELHVRPVPDVLAIFRPYVADSLDFDVDLRELQGQRGVDVLCAFPRAIGRRLGKPVVLYPEGDHDHPILGYDLSAGRVVLHPRAPEPPGV